jgi:hypothetical protein
MTEMAGFGRPKRLQIEATIIRADGTVEHLGVVSDSSRLWRYGPGRVAAWWRTTRANRNVKEN